LDIQLLKSMEKTNDPRFDVQGARIAETHESAKMRTRWSNGKSKRVFHKVSSSSPVGGAMFSDKLTTTKNALNAHIKRQAESAGRLKARWTYAALLWKGAAKLPAWITKHGDKGQVNDQMKANGDGYIEIRNTTPYASQWADINAFVVKSQSKMFSHRIRAVLKKRNAELSKARSA